MMSVFSESNTVHLRLTLTAVRIHTNLFNATKEYKCVSLKKPKPNLYLNCLFCSAATKKDGTE